MKLRAVFILILLLTANAFPRDLTSHKGIEVRLVNLNSHGLKLKTPSGDFVFLDSPYLVTSDFKSVHRSPETAQVNLTIWLEYTIEGKKKAENQALKFGTVMKAHARDDAPPKPTERRICIVLNGKIEDCRRLEYLSFSKSPVLDGLSIKYPDRIVEEQRAAEFEAALQR